MATYLVNPAGLEHAMQLIDARQYVLDSRVGGRPAQGRAGERLPREALLGGVRRWHLGLTEGATEGTKGRYAFVFGDFRRIHRSGIIACHYRAAEWRHKEIELAAHDLLQRLDAKSG